MSAPQPGRYLCEPDLPDGCPPGWYCRLTSAEDLTYRCFPDLGPPICGDGVMGDGEPCDGLDFGGQSCVGEGLAGGPLRCSADCALNLGSCLTQLCGDGRIQGSETCDGSDLAGASCLGAGFGPGEMGCFHNCSLDYRDCEAPSSCGNGVREEDEHCDGGVGEVSCTHFGFPGGVLRCAPNCSFDTSGCLLSICGNGVAEADFRSFEECDGADLREQSCYSLGYPSGSLSCDAECRFDITGCFRPRSCGNGKRQGLELCDGGDLDDTTCRTLGFDHGQLACTENCSFDTSGCLEPTGSVCGDGVLDEDEACDGDLLRFADCTELGYVGGELRCDSHCLLDSRHCRCPPGLQNVGLGCEGEGIYECGNGVQEPGEECDDVDLGGWDCLSLGLEEGTLACGEDCMFDTAGCVVITCPNGMIDPDEECERTDLGGQSCLTLGLPGGPLRCTNECTLDTSGCTGMVLIPAGTYTRGSPPEELCRDAAGEVQHQVQLTRDFLLRPTEVTQGEFLVEMGYHRSRFTGCGLDCPVERVSFHEALYFCNRLSVREGFPECFDCTGTLPDVTCTLKPAYATPYDCPGYRLPTEAEWEYAARGLPTTYTPYPNGDNGSSCDSCAADANLSAIGTYCGNSAVSYPTCIDISALGGAKCAGPHPVGRKPANSLGLFDMAGNVYEWCWDLYGPYPTAPNPLVDPFAPASTTGTNRVMRGGAWNEVADYCRSAHRYYYSGSVWGYNYRLGFRPARTAPP